MRSFSEQMLEMIGCIDVVQVVVRRGTDYPENSCLFTDVVHTHDARLAAAFRLRAASDLWESNEATGYITGRLSELAEVQ